MARAVDDAANIGAWASRTFDVGAQGVPVLIFAQTVTGTPEADPNAVELGVKFRSDATGFISGIRFYKTADNTGAHTGTLWSSAGLNLGTVPAASSSGESATGWQGKLLDAGSPSTPICSIQPPHRCPGTTPRGRPLQPPDWTAHPCTPSRGVDAPNGVYRYGPGGSSPLTPWFPTTWSTSSSSPVSAPASHDKASSAPGRPPQTPPLSRSAPHSHRDLHRADGPGDDHVRDHRGCATRRTRSSRPWSPMPRYIDGDPRPGG